MRLYDFIESSMEEILQAWENFARSVRTEQPKQDAAGLRNHGERILRTIAADMRKAQTAHQQSEKAKGRGPQASSETAAQTHAMTRLIAGFSMDQMVSEYRALRSSVLSLWLAQEGSNTKDHVQDMIRFNEAIDQALVESIAAYGAAVDSTRKMILAVLGHDLRSPLGAVLMAGDLLLRQEGVEGKGRILATQVCTSARRATGIVNDLLDLARCNLGTGIPVYPENVELNPICRAVIEELQMAFPAATIIFKERGQVTGQFDSARMAQVFSNLVGNAIHHGDKASPITVTLTHKAAGPCINVHNSGEPIPVEAMPYLFSPEGRYSGYASSEKGSAAGLGLGLFIASEIVASHGGRIEVESTAKGGTTFEVVLPLSSASSDAALESP